jgi:CRISPR/Cas system CSM-associated protein Csm3 (group 7 of RAMP superfamily)
MMNPVEKQTQIKNQIEKYEIRLVTKGPFRIGAIADPMSSISNPIATVNRRPVVQGSSLKGALRASIERYLIENYPTHREMKPCIPSAWNNLSDEEKALINQGKYGGPACTYGQPICPVCYLLGAQGIMGFLRIPYLYSDIEIEELYEVRIDRALEVVAKRTNRDYQIVPDGAEFKGVLELLTFNPVTGWAFGQKRYLRSDKGNIDIQDNWISLEWNKEKIFKDLVIDRLKAIKLLGGFKSKGCGTVEIKVFDKDGKELPQS